MESALIRLYTAILHYTALIQKTQDTNIERKLLDCVTALTEHPLTELKNSVENERNNIHKWIGLVGYLHHQKKAESILHKIDKLAESMKSLLEQFSLANLRVAEEISYNSRINEHEDFCLPNTRKDVLSEIKV